MRRIQFVVLGGGHGVSQLLRGLVDAPSRIFDITAIITGADSGGSSGKFIKSGMFPPGDLTRAALALAPPSPLIDALILARTIASQGDESPDSARNILLFQLWNDCRHNIQEAIDMFGSMVGSRGRVIPSTLSPCDLCAHIEGDFILRGEHSIDAGHSNGRRINRVWLENTKPNPWAIDAIRNASFIVLGPGDLYTSIVPVLLVPGIRDALEDTPASVIYIMNLMTKKSETWGFTAADFVEIIAKYTGHVECVLANSAMPEPGIIARYAATGAPVVVPSDCGDISGIPVFSCPLAVVVDGNLCHNPYATQAALRKLLTLS